MPIPPREHYKSFIFVSFKNLMPLFVKDAVWTTLPRENIIPYLTKPINDAALIVFSSSLSNILLFLYFLIMLISLLENMVSSKLAEGAGFQPAVVF